MVFTTFGQADPQFKRGMKACVRIFEIGVNDCIVACPYGQDVKQCGLRDSCADCDFRFECATERN